MKQLLRSQSLPALPAAAGVLGLLLRLWLFSAIDEKGLLPARHFADTAVFLLTAVVLGILLLITQKPMARPVRKGVPALAGILGCALGGIGFLCTGLRSFSAYAARFSGIAALAGIVGGLVLLAMQLSIILSCVIYCIKILRENFTHGCVLFLMFGILFVTLFLSCASGITSNKFFWILIMIQMTEIFTLKAKTN